MGFGFRDLGFWVLGLRVLGLGLGVWGENFFWQLWGPGNSQQIVHRAHDTSIKEDSFKKARVIWTISGLFQLQWV